jgi:hypothetical protein
VSAIAKVFNQQHALTEERNRAGGCQLGDGILRTLAPPYDGRMMMGDEVILDVTISKISVWPSAEVL